MAMDKFKIFIFLISATTLFSCSYPDSTEKNKKNGPDTNQTSHSKIYDDIRQNLKGASFADTVKETKFLNFSDKNRPDKFELTVLPGLLSKSKAILIISSDKHVIYADTFDTDFLVRYIFQPDTVPTSGGQEAYEKYLIEYVQSLTKKRFEEYTRENIKKFFDELYVDPKQVEKIADFDNILNKELYNAVYSDTSRKVIYLPCFSCDYGGYYLTYSTKDKKAVIIIASD